MEICLKQNQFDEQQAAVLGLEVRSPSMECFGDCCGAEIPRIGASECVEATVVSMNTFREL